MIQTGTYVYSEFEVKAEEVTVNQMHSISMVILKNMILDINKIGK